MEGGNKISEEEVFEIFIDLIRKLKDENGVSLREITWQMLSICSMLVSESDYDLDEEYLNSGGFEDDEESDQEDQLRVEAQNAEDKYHDELYGSEAHKNIDALQKKHWRQEQLENYSECVVIMEEIAFEIMPKRCEELVLAIENYAKSVDSEHAKNMRRERQPDAV